METTLPPSGPKSKRARPRPVRTIKHDWFRSYLVRHGVVFDATTQAYGDEEVVLLEEGETEREWPIAFEIPGRAHVEEWAGGIQGAIRQPDILFGWRSPPPSFKGGDDALVEYIVEAVLDLGTSNHTSNPSASPDSPASPSSLLSSGGEEDSEEEERLPGFDESANTREERDEHGCLRSTRRTVVCRTVFECGMFIHFSAGLMKLIRLVDVGMLEPRNRDVMPLYPTLDDGEQEQDFVQFGRRIENEGIGGKLMLRTNTMLKSVFRHGGEWRTWEKEYDLRSSKLSRPLGILRTEVRPFLFLYSKPRLTSPKKLSQPSPPLLGRTSETLTLYLALSFRPPPAPSSSSFPFIKAKPAENQMLYIE
ncbi:hypothetical protein BT69DRAFT_1306133, partial [Atractiella rhizophila]